LAGIAVDAMARPAILKRRTPGATIDFEWVPGVETSTPIRAVIQDPKEADIRQLPEGERVESYQTIWTRTELRTADEDAGTEADRVVSENGQTFKITRVSARDEAGFYRAIARLEHDGGRRV
jgi:predicted nucleic acid-binding protein